MDLPLYTPSFFFFPSFHHLIGISIITFPSKRKRRHKTTMHNEQQSNSSRGSGGIARAGLCAGGGGVAVAGEEVVELVEAELPERGLVSAERFHDPLEEVRVAGDGEAAGLLKPVLLLRPLQ